MLSASFACLQGIQSRKALPKLPAGHKAQAGEVRVRYTDLPHGSGALCALCLHCSGVHKHAQSSSAGPVRLHTDDMSRAYVYVRMLFCHATTISW
jgi:hypothetical protein